MHAIDRFRQPRAESVLTDDELAAIRVPTLFILGSNDPYLSPQDARPSIDRIPAATVHEMPAGHGPWLVDAARIAALIATHIQQTALVES
jgi:pimeloyl-ACP methyl ester carboxylesterase